MQTRPDPRHLLRELCDELADLATRLGDAIAPQRPYNGAGPAEDPSLAAPVLAATLTATAPRYSTRRRVPTSREPLHLELFAARRAIETTALDLAARAREALGDVTRDRTPADALKNLPMLLGRLDPAHVVTREALGDERRDGILARRRRRARIALDIDRRPLALAPCPSVQDDYLATWAGGFEPAADWADGVCREYDPEASAHFTRRRRDSYEAAVEAGSAEPGRVVEPVEIWYRSVLHVADPEASPGSDGAAVRCAGCGRVWRTDAEMRRLAALLGTDPRVAGMVASARTVLYGRLAAAMRREVAARRK